jgi:CRISPR-associated protein Csd2
MAVRKLIIFKHDSELGNAPAFQLFDRVRVSRKDVSKPARSYCDYEVVIDENDLPQGVTCIQRL